MSKKGVTVEFASASAQLQTARIRSSRDGLWRIILTPNNAFGKALRDTIEAISGSGRTELSSSGGKVTVTSEPQPFGDSTAILIPMGKWDSVSDLEILKAWKARCRGESE